MSRLKSAILFIIGLLLGMQNLFAESVVLTQSMLSSTLVPSTSFIVTQDLAIGTQPLIIPDNCEITFSGGSLSGGVLIGNKTIIKGDVKLFCETKGSFQCEETKLSWFIKPNSEDQTEALRRAIDFCSLTSSKQLNGERLAVNTFSEIVFTEKNDIRLSNMHINFHPSANAQSMFVFDSSVKYTGGNKYIRDCVFKCTNNKFINICCLNFKRWYNINGFIADNIRILDFSGYAIVNSGYLQESVFSNIICFNVGGFISYNIGTIWGAPKGSSNIIHFDNCSINNGIQGYNTSIPALIDLNNCGEARFSNLVMQGTSNGQKQKAIIVSGSNYSVPTTLTLDGCWVEFIGKATPENSTIDINTPCHCILNRRTPLHINVNSDAVVLDINASNILPVDDFLNNVHIEKGKKVLLRFDSYMTQSFKLDKIHELMSKGYIIDFTNSYNPWSKSSASVAVRLESDLVFDGMKYMIEHSSGVSYRGLKTYMSNINGCNVLVFEDAYGTNRNMLFPIPKSLFHDTENTIFTVVRDCLIRITLLEDVKEGNIDNVNASSPFYSIAYSRQGASYDPLNVKIGDKSGKTTGWMRLSDVTEGTKAWLQSTCYGNVKNIKLEIAKLDYFRSKASFDENIYVSSTGELSIVNYEIPHYVMSQSTKMDKSLWNFMKGATAYWHIGDDIYYSHNGIVTRLTTEVVSY